METGDLQGQTGSLEHKQRKITYGEQIDSAKDKGGDALTLTEPWTGSGEVGFLGGGGGSGPDFF